MTIIETMDAILVCPRSSGEKVKEIVRILSAEKDDRVNRHTTVHRPWGSYTILEDGGTFRIKRVVVRPQHRLSLQMHHHRSEHWVVISGTAKVTIGNQEYLVKQGESTFVPVKVKHRLENPDTLPLEIIEVQMGDPLTEDDITRYDDDFDRIG
jgi:mannose-1-phosphate guanylyltransferase/mannose-6-phosphate isomerase